MEIVFRECGQIKIEIGHRIQHKTQLELNGNSGGKKTGTID